MLFGTSYRPVDNLALRHSAAAVLQQQPINSVFLSPLPALESDSLIEATKQGLGLAIKSKLAIEQELKTGQLIEVKLDQLKPSQAQCGLSPHLMEKIA